MCSSRLKTRCRNLYGEIIITKGTDVTVIMGRLLLSCGPPTDKISLIFPSVAAPESSLPTPTRWMNSSQIVPAESVHTINNYLSSLKQSSLARSRLSSTYSLKSVNFDSSISLHILLTFHCAALPQVHRLPEKQGRICHAVDVSRHSYIAVLCHSWLV